MKVKQSFVKTCFFPLRHLHGETTIRCRETDFGFGTPEYIAPEVLLSKGHGKGVDWWTLGILIYEVLVGEPPFLDDNPLGIYQQILTGKISFSRSYDKNAKS
ncbi:LOW QUALITY PROTEIN: hypothetical protein HJC23_003047 [Cyclotella cryptica]|uniref:Protein kinase domain-containing protein n=1 Tax=Cyclotella cryptica TaxID=29204 RepID=A0ABD3PZ71_9STRA